MAALRVNFLAVFGFKRFGLNESTFQKHPIRYWVIKDGLVECNQNLYFTLRPFQDPFLRSQWLIQECP